MILESLTFSSSTLFTIGGIVFALGGAYYLLIHIGNEGKKIKTQQIDDGKEITKISGKVDLLDERTKNMEQRMSEHHENMSKRFDRIESFMLNGKSSK